MSTNTTDREAAKARVRAKRAAEKAMPARNRIAHILHATMTHADIEALLTEVERAAEKRSAETIRAITEHHEAGKKRWRDQAQDAEGKLHALAQVRVWRDGNGDGFLAADDVAAAIGSEQVGMSEVERRARVLREAADRADAMGYTWAPLVRQWADEAEAEPCACEPDGHHHAAGCPVADVRQAAAEVEALRARVAELEEAMAAEPRATEGAVTQTAHAIRARALHEGADKVADDTVHMLYGSATDYADRHAALLRGMADGSAPAETAGSSRTEVLAEAIEAARGEYLTDQTGTPEDDAYNRGVADAIAAIGALTEGDAA